MAKPALITGVTGQDGSYLAELLLDKGYEVHGMVARSSSMSRARIDHLLDSNPDRDQAARLFLHYGDMTDSGVLNRLIAEIRPAEVYNLAAQSHVQISFDLPEYTGEADALGTTRLLEAIRSAGTGSRFYQASTAELFGSTPPPHDEGTPFHPRSPYAVAKLYAHWMTVNYREARGFFACNGILFSHESPRRGENFVTRKVTKGVARILTGQTDRLALGNLDARRDLGHARDYERGGPDSTDANGAVRLARDQAAGGCGLGGVVAGASSDDVHFVSRGQVLAELRQQLSGCRAVGMEVLVEDQ